MNKVRRVERMVAMTKLLVDSPQKLISLNYFCDFFGMAKSTVSEDLTCVRQSMEHFQLGTLETVAGVAGGVRLIEKAIRPMKSCAMCSNVCVNQIVLFPVDLFICRIFCMIGM